MKHYSWINEQRYVGQYVVTFNAATAQLEVELEGSFLTSEIEV